MSINDFTFVPSEGASYIRNRSNLIVSFEVMPPRSASAVQPFFHTLRELIAVRPDFVSVTYGAGGKDRKNATSLVTTLVADTPTHPIAHLTTVGASKTEISDVIESYLNEGVRTFLALRGDPPTSDPTWAPGADGVRSAAELISLIKLIEARRVAADSGLALRQAVRPLTLAVATFVEGNPQAGTTAEQEIDNLFAKQEAGANLAITQLFWNACAYREFVSEARKRGVRIPIIPGVLPPVSAQRVRRVGELTGVKPPSWIIDALENSEDPQARGVQIGAALVRELLEENVPGIHVYTFNKSEPALAILRSAGLITEDSTNNQKEEEK